MVSVKLLRLIVLPALEAPQQAAKGEQELSLKIAFDQGNYLKSDPDNFSCLSLKSRAIKAVTQVLN